MSLSGDTIANVQMRAEDTVADLKASVARSGGPPCCLQALLFEGKALVDAETVHGMSFLLGGEKSVTLVWDGLDIDAYIDNLWNRSERLLQEVLKKLCALATREFFRSTQC